MPGKADLQLLSGGVSRVSISTGVGAQSGECLIAPGGERPADVLSIADGHKPVGQAGVARVGLPQPLLDRRVLVQQLLLCFPELLHFMEAFAHRHLPAEEELEQ
jgi:hypothetical protein